MDEQLVYFLIGFAVLALVVVLFTRRNQRRAEKQPPRLREDKLVGRQARRRLQGKGTGNATRVVVDATDGGGVERRNRAPARRRVAPRPGAEVLRAGLQKTRGGFIARLGELLGGKKEVDGETLERLEEVLLTADIGPRTAQKLYGAIRTRLSKSELAEPATVWEAIAEETRTILAIDWPPVDFASASPFVLLVVGVNGAGKTTTIGKLAAKLTAEGRKVLLGAGDTYRAAATQQLEVWGARAGVPVVTGREGADPSSVLFDAVKRGAAEGYDVVICDTAGRLHTKNELMAELTKVCRVIGKAAPGAPHETWLVLDATQGQNALQQAITFGAATGLTGLVMTKLDGTAKGGVILGIADELRLPVRYVGIGEKVEDLRAFDADDFVAALYERDQGDDVEPPPTPDARDGALQTTA